MATTILHRKYPNWKTATLHHSCTIPILLLCLLCTRRIRTFRTGTWKLFLTRCNGRCLRRQRFNWKATRISVLLS
ncbi:hypothetical protein F4814DRAFT_430369 [Daldinia grandis]|nr:hypothetical protein F4814DRAFT_430369 [Daldinia grandis]